LTATGSRLELVILLLAPLGVRVSVPVIGIRNVKNEDVGPIVIVKVSDGYLARLDTSRIFFDRDTGTLSHREIHNGRQSFPGLLTVIE